MSIASMVDTKMALQRGVSEEEHSPAKPIGVSTGIVDQITRWIPTETITAYVALLALLAPPAKHARSYASRWILLGIVVAANPVVVLLLAMAKNQPGDELLVSGVRDADCADRVCGLGFPPARHPAPATLRA